MEQKTVVVGMSGGVDSSVAALLLKEQGYNVIGLYMVNWEEQGENGCCTAETDYEDVRRVCNKIGIPYYTVNFSKNMPSASFPISCASTRRAERPIPTCCATGRSSSAPSRTMRSGWARITLPTGHYCDILHQGDVHYLLKAADANKDQTYFLNQVTQKQLENVLFPLGKLQKPQVRAIAEKYGLSTAAKKDSTGICFIGERNFRNFLRGYLPARPGKMMTRDGKVIGEHIGLMYYTLGQRKGWASADRKGRRKADAGSSSKRTSKTTFCTWRTATRARSIQIPVL